MERSDEAEGRSVEKETGESGKADSEDGMDTGAPGEKESDGKNQNAFPVDKVFRIHEEKSGGGD